MQTERMTPERRAEIERDLESVREPIEKLRRLGDTRWETHYRAFDLLTELRAVEQENRTLREAYDGTQRILASGVGMLESLDRIAKLHKMGRGARAGGGTDA